MLDLLLRQDILSHEQMNERRSSTSCEVGGESFKVFGFHPALFFLLCVCTPGVFAAQAPVDPAPPDLTEVPLEKLMQIEIPTVFGASKFDQKETEAPSSVTVIGSDDIKKYGYRTLADVLRSVPGMYVSYDRNYAFLGAGGIDLGDFNSRILLVVDGHRLNSDLTDGAYIDTAFILDVDLIDHVEIIQGPGSVLYGDNAFFGVINVVTRMGRQLNGVEASGEYGGFDTYKGRLTYGKLFDNGLELLLSGSWYDSAGQERLFFHEFDTPAQNNGIAQDMDSDSAKSAFGSVSYRDFTLEGAFIEREKQNPTAQYFTAFNDPRLRTTDDRGYANLKFAHEFPNVVDVAAQVYYDEAEFRLGYPFSLPGGSTLFKETDLGEWWGTELQLTRRLWDQHTLTAGADFRDDFRQDRTITQPDTGQVFTDVHQDRQIYGVFGQADIAVLTNLHVNAGVRYDRAGNFNSAVSPRVALLYNPVPTSTLKAIYGTAFRAPNFLELSDPRFQDLQPEEIKTCQLVYEQQIGNHVRSMVTGFFNRMDNLIVLQDGMFTNLNVESKGIEFAAEGKWSRGLRARASYTLEGARDISSPEALPNSPHHLVKLNVSVPVYAERIFASLEFQYTSTRHTVFTTPIGDTVPGTDAAGFGVVNFTVFSQEFVKNLEFSAGVYNLLDKRYGDPSSRFHTQDIIGQDGRSFRLKLTYRF